jgi:hypothetical protein
MRARGGAGKDEADAPVRATARPRPHAAAPTAASARLHHSAAARARRAGAAPRRRAGLAPPAAPCHRGGAAPLHARARARRAPGQRSSRPARVQSARRHSRWLRVVRARACARVKRPAARGGAPRARRKLARTFARTRIERTTRKLLRLPVSVSARIWGRWGRAASLRARARARAAAAAMCAAPRRPPRGRPFHAPRAACRRRRVARPPPPPALALRTPAVMCLQRRETNVCRCARTGGMRASCVTRGSSFVTMPAATFISSPRAERCPSRTSTPTRRLCRPRRGGLPLPSRSRRRSCSSCSRTSATSSPRRAWCVCPAAPVRARRRDACEPSALLPTPCCATRASVFWFLTGGSACILCLGL